MRIAFCGPPGAGKTTAARYLATKGFEVRSFAAELRSLAKCYEVSDSYKRQLAVVSEWVVERLPKLAEAWRSVYIPAAAVGVFNSTSYEPTGKNRAFLQKLGGAIRQVYPEFWVELVTADPPANCVLDDLRYPNEMAALQAAGFAIYRITAPEELRLERMQARDGAVDRAALASPVEHALDGVELPAFDNSGEFQHLHAWLDALVVEAAATT